MIDRLICVYLDLQQVSSEVGSVINVSRYGEILYKKQKLKTYHERIYANCGINQFFHVYNEKTLLNAIDIISLDLKYYVIIHHSSFAVTIAQEFALFLEKVKYLDSNLVVADFETPKPFVILKADKAIQLLEKVSKSSDIADEILEEAEITEKFRLEKFHKTIKTSVDFIEFLHTNFEARYFNSIEKDDLYITKSSDKIKKIENEYLYYSYLPEELKVFFIKPMDFRKGDGWCSYKLEKLNVPDVAIQWVHNSLTPKEFKNLLHRLFRFINSRPLKEMSSEESKKTIEKFYITKVAERIEELKNKAEYKIIADILRNSCEFESIDLLFERYKQQLKQILDKKKYQAKLALSHGDPCASNILYDKRINLLKLIDPRGAETQEGLYFDSYYDVCKLSHSILGDYDFINNGLFELVYDSNLRVSLKIDSYYEKKLFHQPFIALLHENNFDYELVRIFEASLFISMLPLHIDNPKKVLAFILNAIKILNHLQETKK